MPLLAKLWTPRTKIIVFAVIAITLAIAWWLLGRPKSMSKLVIAATEAHQVEAIGVAKGKAEVLLADTNADQTQVHAIQDEIQRRKLALANTYKSADMSTDDVVARFQELHI